MDRQALPKYLSRSRALTASAGRGGAGQGGRGASAPVCQALGVTTKCEVIHIIVTLTPHTVC